MSCSKSARGGSHGWLADRGAVLTDRQRVPWWRHHQWIVLSVVLLIVVGGVVSAYLRTVNGSGDATEMGPEELAVLIGVAVPSLVLVPLTRRWRIWIWECLLAVLAWAIFLGPAGDLFVYRLCFRGVDPDPSRSPPGNTLPGCPLRPFAATTAGRLTCIINASRYHPHCLRRGFRVATSRWGAVSRLGRNLLSVSGPRYYRRPV